MMRRVGQFIGGLTAAALFAAPAMAELKKAPSPIFASPYDWGAKGDTRAFTALMFYANCVVHVQRGPTSKFLAFNFTAKNRMGPAQDLSDGAGLCADGIPAMLGDFEYLRGALIEAAYDEDILKKSGKPLMSLGTSVPDKASRPPILARCVVSRRPQESAALLRTKITSSDQARAISQLQPDLDQCARETSSQVTYPELLRFQIAEELYRRASTGAGSAGNKR